MRIEEEELMKDRKLNTRSKNDNKNKSLKIVIVAIIITILLIVITILVLIKITPIDTSFKVYINGELNKKINTNIFAFDNDKVYIKVRDIAGIVGYEVHNGEYKIEAEDMNKIFVENKEETASIFLNSTIIKKIEPNSSNEYKDYEMSEPARNIDGEIYIISDGLEVACNLQIDYDKSTNSIKINTLEHLYNIYNEAVLSKGYIELSDSFENRKAILYKRLVVKNADNRYGVIDLNEDEVIGTRYALIEFDEYTQEFTITNQNGKMGIDYISGETKIEVNYDEIKSIQKENEIYLVKSNSKYGVIDGEGRIIIHMEYDDIGVDLSPYIDKSSSSEKEDSNNNNNNQEIKQYIFFEKIIPVKQNDKYGFFNINGNKISDIKYTGIGCYAKAIKDKNGRIIEESKKTTSNILTIDEYELIIVEGTDGYGIIDMDAIERVDTTATDIYKVTDAGVKYYYMVYHGNVYNLETDLFEKISLQKKTDS